MVEHSTKTNTDITLKHFTRLIISFSFTLILLSFYQYSMFYYKGVIDSIFSVSFLLSTTHHIGYGSFVGLLLVAPFHFLEKYKHFRGFRFTLLFLIFLLVIEAVLMEYYITTFTPLGADFWGYTWLDIKAAFLNSGGLSFVKLIVLIIVCVLFYYLYKFTARYYHHINKMFPFTFILLIIFIATLFIKGQPINQNKTQYLAVNLYLGSLEDDSYLKNKNLVEYPLLRNNNTENVLGGYFNLKDDKPNIVFLIVEGLGRDFVGKGAEFKGFMPYLDSLTEKSLYWENCFSNTGRTFGVLPSLLGSLPFGKNGFMEVDNSLARHTIFSILKNNEYYTSFLQGTNISFDNVDNFLNEEKVDFILDRSGFGKGYTSSSEFFESSWGFPDKELFKKGLSLKRNANIPCLDVYLTISNHEPFIAPNHNYFENRVAQLLKKSPLPKRTKKIIKKNDNIFATLLYTDNAIKWFIESYSKKEKFKNTIFIITGSHRVNPLPLRNELSRYHVPLLIYSPLLKSSKKMSAIVSHFDVAPSILSMLAAKYKINVPNKIAWMGTGLDMGNSFRGTKNIPLMKKKNYINEYIYNTEFYSDGNTYKIDENINLNKTTNLNIKPHLVNFKSLNSYVTKYNKILPDSLDVYKLDKNNFTEADKIWVNSVLNGQNFDNAYKTAKEMAVNDDRKGALRLCSYILSEVPSHIDTRILMGRINAWDGKYNLAENILKECITINPTYADPYAALLDVYFWSKQNNKALFLAAIIRENNINDTGVLEKVKRIGSTIK